MKNDFVIYTAIFGDYDNLISVQEKYDDCDFICFTDQIKIKSNIWKIILVDSNELTLILMNRKYKLLPHLFLADYNYSLYIDGNIFIKSNSVILCKKYLEKNDFFIPKHNIRNCIYEEAKTCISLGKSKFNETFNQMQIYTKKGFPRDYGLGENNIILRRHNDTEIISIMTDWWNELNTKTQRDQLSLGYILWKNNKNYNFMNENTRVDNPYFGFINHKYERKSLSKRIKKALLFKYYSWICNLYWRLLR